MDFQSVTFVAKEILKKMNSMKKILFALFIGCFSFAGFGQNSPSRELINVKVDAVFLASDLLEGRKTGSDGEKAASEYLAHRFEEIGLAPKGAAGTWYQPFAYKYGANPHSTEPDETGTGRNVLAFLDHGAEHTVIIGAHYDHLGMGLPGASLHSGEPSIHNGADDNASGVAAMFYLAEQLKNDPGKYKKNNYLFIGFSGEEMGLYGSKYFVENPTVDLDKVNYMLNMDMVGRLNEEKVLAVYGAGTTPAWKEILDDIKVADIKIKTTDSGVGPSDHTSFYLKNMPVLHFFTGQHADYHKPSDDSELLNYQGILDVSKFILKVIERANQKGKLEFTKTKDEQQQGASFKVTLGVMPDYVFDGEGMKIDAVLDDRPAQKAGLEGGDVIIQMGDLEVKNIYDYMEGLSKFEKGDTTTVKVKRGKKTVKKEVTF